MTAYEEIFGFRWLRAPHPLSSPAKGSCSSGGNFDYGFLQIPHWPVVIALPPCKGAYPSASFTMTGFFGHPCLRLLIPFSQGLWREFHPLVDDHAGHTPSNGTIALIRSTPVAVTNS